MKIIAYTDGSYDSEKNRCGYGAVLLTQEGEPCRTLYGSFTPAEDENGWNINGEIRAAMEAVLLSRQLGASQVEIHHDYEGVGKWATLAWKRNKTYTKAYAQWMQEQMRELEITFVPVKGHSGDRLNNAADAAARRGVGCTDEEVHVVAGDIENPGMAKECAVFSAGRRETDPENKVTLLKDATIITEYAHILPHMDLYIRNGKIVLLCAAGENPGLSAGTDTAALEPDEIIDCHRFFVSPGLTNLHAHTAMNIFKGIAEDVTADAWFNEMIWPYESKMTGDDVYTGTMLGIAEMISNGVTAVADHYFAEEKVLQAALDSGIRMDIAPTIFGMAPDYRDRISQVSEFIKNHDGVSDRIFLRFGPHSNYTCPEPVLGEIIDAAKAMHKPIHLHLAEEEAQVIKSRQQTGKTPFAVLHDAGGFDLPVMVAHGLWIEEDDLAYLKNDTWFAFCPKTYMKLASGRGGFFRYCDRLNYSFGTDGAASSNTLSPVEQARLFALLEKFETGDATVRKAQYIWERLMAGHAAMQFGTGVISEGAPADLVIWDLWTPDTAAFYNPVSAIIYSSTAQNVRYTMVGGEFLKYDGRLKMDVNELMENTRCLQSELIARGRGKAEVFYG